MWHTREMPKQIDFKLNETELSIIEESLKQSGSARIVKRATALRMLHLGQRPQEVADVLSVSLPTVYEWFQRFRAEGAAGLDHHPKSGRPPTADESYIQALEETLETEPGELGYDFTLWTIERLNQHVSKVTGKQVVDERVRTILKERDWVYRRPKEDLAAKQDKEAREWAEEFLDELKKGPATPAITSFSLWTKRP
jgi:transposase